MNVFADAFYYIALLNPHDQYHQRVVDFTRNAQGILSTSIWILVEVADAFSDHRRKQVVGDLIEGLQQAGCDTEIVPATQEWFDRGMKLYLNRRDKDWSLTDCISFEIMRERCITDALTGDHHFTQAGFHALFATQP